MKVIDFTSAARKVYDLVRGKNVTVEVWRDVINPAEPGCIVVCGEGSIPHDVYSIMLDCFPDHQADRIYEPYGLVRHALWEYHPGVGKAEWGAWYVELPEDGEKVLGWFIRIEWEAE